MPAGVYAAQFVKSHDLTITSSEQIAPPASAEHPVKMQDMAVTSSEDIAPPMQTADPHPVKVQEVTRTTEDAIAPPAPVMPVEQSVKLQDTASTTFSE
jgi:hypothetical protein